MSDSCDLMDHGLPGSSVHGILQAGVLEWIAISFSRGAFQPSNWTQVSCIAGRFFTNWTTREASYKLPVVFYLFEVIKPNNFYYDGLIWLYHFLSSKTYIHKSIMEFI